MQLVGRKFVRELLDANVGSDAWQAFEPRQDVL
jgi:hypothetical protein